MTILAMLLAIVTCGKLCARQSLEPLKASATPSEVTSPPLHLADRIVDKASLVGLDGQNWKFSFGDGSSSELNAQLIVRWGKWRGAIDRSSVWLNDGSWIAGDIGWSGQDQVTISNRWLQINTIPLRQIRGIVLLPAASLADWIRIQQFMENATGEDDVLLLKDRRRLSGVIDWTSLSSNSQLKLSTSGQGIAIPLEEIEAIVASPGLFGPVPATQLKIGLSDGSFLNAKEVKSSNQRALITLSSLMQVETLDKPEEFVRAINFLSCDRVPKAQYLDQLKPVSYRHASINQLEFELGIGKDVSGGPLQLGNRRQTGIVFHGLAMHSSSQAAYRWDRSPGRLLAEVRLAPSTNDLGSAICKVLLARNGSLQTATEFSLDAINHNAAHFVDLDIEHSQLVVLVVEKSNQSQYGDQVVWLDARITSQKN